MAILAAILAAFLFGGVSRADEASLQSAAEAQSSSGIVAEAQSSGVTTTVADTDNETQSSSGVAGEAQSSSTANTEQSSSGGSVATAATTDSNCTPRPISAEEIQTDFKTSDGSPEVTAYEAVEFSVNLTLKEGHCNGDTISISVPSELGTDADFAPIPMTTPEGIVIGYATYSADHTVSIKLTDAVEVPGRVNFHASAWWRVHMSSSLIPGETRELKWDVGGTVRRTTIRVGTCDGCSVIGKNPSKWGSVDKERQHVTIVLPTATQDSQQFVVTDTLTSPGQKFVCSSLLNGRVGVYSSAGNWGQPQYVRFEEPDIVSCTDDKATLNIQLNQGEKARVELNINVSATDPGPWTDTASITSQNKSWEVVAKVARKESGGNAGFDNTPTPAPTPEPTPTPEPSPSTTPEPSPSATPSTPTPSTTPSVTPTPSPSTTPTRKPVPLPTPVIERYEEPTPSATPTPAPQHKKLAVTGTSGDVVTSAVALVALGGFLIWVRRRQTARSER
jgi:putative lipoprotein